MKRLDMHLNKKEQTEKNIGQIVKGLSIRADASRPPARGRLLSMDGCMLCQREEAGTTEGE